MKLVPIVRSRVLGVRRVKVSDILIVSSFQIFTVGDASGFSGTDDNEEEEEEDEEASSNSPKQVISLY